MSEKKTKNYYVRKIIVYFHAFSLGEVVVAYSGEWLDWNSPTDSWGPVLPY